MYWRHTDPYLSAALIIGFVAAMIGIGAGLYWLAFCTVFWPVLGVLLRRIFKKH